MLDKDGNPTIRTYDGHGYYLYQIPLLGTDKKNIHISYYREPVLELFQEKHRGLCAWKNNRLRIQVYGVCRELCVENDQIEISSRGDLELVLELDSIPSLCPDLRNPDFIHEDFFMRKVTVPFEETDVAGIGAAFKDGVLRIFVAKVLMSRSYKVGV